jgi:hypothetical protein
VRHDLVLLEIDVFVFDRPALSLPQDDVKSVPEVHIYTRDRSTTFGVNLISTIFTYLLPVSFISPRRASMEMGPNSSIDELS